MLTDNATITGSHVSEMRASREGSLHLRLIIMTSLQRREMESWRGRALGAVRVPPPRVAFRGTFHLNRQV